MEFPFYKLRTGSRDYILVNNTSPPLIDEKFYPRLAYEACRRRYGIGATGIIFITKGMETRLSATVFNRKGEPELSSSDPSFCLGRYAFDSGHFANRRFDVEVGGVVRRINCIDSSTFRVSLGIPKHPDGEAIVGPVLNYDYISPVDFDGKRIPTVPIAFDTSYAVIITAERKNPIKSLIEGLVQSEALGTACPVCIKLITTEEARIYTEKNRPESDAAETAGAAVVAANLMGLCERICAVRGMGAQYFVEWSERDNQVYAAGSAVYTYSGQYFFDDGVSVGPRV